MSSAPVPDAVDSFPVVTEFSPKEFRYDLRGNVFNVNAVVSGDWLGQLSSKVV
jgi:hypothetical protein